MNVTSMGDLQVPNRASFGRALLVFAMLLWPLVYPGIASAQAVYSHVTPKSGPEFSDFGATPRPRAANSKTFPRTPEGKPDFTGIWFVGLKGFAAVNERDVAVPLTPAYAAKRRQWQQATDRGTPYADSVSRCEAFGMPHIMGMAPLEFIMSPGKQLTIISEILHEVRRVYLDGRPHPKDFDPGYDGHSIGHWEGDTLVVDTVGLVANSIDDGIWLSDQAHVVERIRMANPNGIIDEMTITDPVALTRPWKVNQYYKRQPSSMEIQEYVCTNNRNKEDAKGFQTAQ